MNNFLNPIEVFNQINLKEDMIAVDFGCGSGGWVIPLARKLNKGKIYAIDILEEPLSALKGKIEDMKIFNIETMKADVEKEVLIMDTSVDLVLMTNLLFQTEDKEAVFKEADKILKENGKILIIDWKSDTGFGPEHRILKQNILPVAEKIGFVFEKDFDAGTYHYGLVLNKA